MTPAPVVKKRGRPRKKNNGITYRGEFSGYNKPKRTPGKSKKFAVLAKVKTGLN